MLQQTWKILLRLFNFRLYCSPETRQHVHHWKETAFFLIIFSSKTRLWQFARATFPAQKKQKNKERGVLKKHLQITTLSRLEEGEEKTTNTQKLPSYWIANHLPLDTYDYFLLSLGKVQPLLSFVLQKSIIVLWHMSDKEQKKIWPQYLFHDARHDAFNKPGSQVGILQFKATKDRSVGKVINTRSL